MRRTDVSAGWESERDPVAAPARSTGWKVEVGGGEQSSSRALTGKDGAACSQ